MPEVAEYSHPLQLDWHYMERWRMPSKSITASTTRRGYPSVHATQPFWELTLLETWSLISICWLYSENEMKMKRWTCHGAKTLYNRISTTNLVELETYNGSFWAHSKRLPVINFTDFLASTWYLFAWALKYGYVWSQPMIGTMIVFQNNLNFN